MATEICMVRSIEKNVYIIDITMQSLEDGDYKESIRSFGEESIEIGGAIEDSTSTVLATIPSKKIKLSELPNNPIKQKFAQSTYGDLAKDVAIAWFEQVKERITDYVAEKIAKFDDFTTEETINI